MFLPKMILALSLGLFPVTSPVVPQDIFIAQQKGKWYVVEENHIESTFVYLEKWEEEGVYVFIFKIEPKRGKRQVVPKSNQIVAHTEFIGALNCLTQKYSIGNKKIVKTDGSVARYSKEETGDISFPSEPSPNTVGLLFDLVCTK